MNRCILLFLFPVICLMAGCAANRHSSRLAYSDIAAIAWNEDSAHSYAIALVRPDRFFYNITHKDSTGQVDAYYKGKFRYSADTIFLTYSNDAKAQGLTDYLTVEGSGYYLIQPGVDNKRIFLRLQRLRSSHFLDMTRFDPDYLNNPYP